MAAGMPDYQSIVRPKYGGAWSRGGSKYVDANKITDLVYVEGRGILYGGSLWLDFTSTQVDSIPRFTVDKSLLNNLSFHRLDEYCIDRPGTMPLTLNRFDIVNHVYSVSLGYGITFEYGISLSYEEVYNEQVQVHYRLVYALL